jgi:glycosyltransferase involved in cell wall biosynthesis
LTVALVSTQADWGGGEEQARLLAQGLREAGHDCRILAREGGLFAQWAAGDGFEVETFAGRGRSPWSLWRVRRYLRRVRPHVLHTNDAHALSAAGLAALGLTIPARVTMRHVAFDLRWPSRYRRLCDRVICVSQAAADKCRAAGLPQEHIRVVHPGVDGKRIAGGDRERGRIAAGVGPDQFLLLAVGKLTQCKGHVFLLDALPAILARHPQVCLAVAGDGELLEPLRNQAARLGIAEKVRFLGYRNDVPDLIHGADLFVFPSCVEGFGCAAIDAMLAGVPVVTTTAGGLPEVTGMGEADQPPTAWSVPPGEVRTLADAILEAIENPAERAARARHARVRAERHFLAERMVAATLDVYRELLAGSSATACTSAVSLPALSCNSPAESLIRR